MSQGIALPPISSAIASSGSALRPSSDTRAPCAASILAAAAPMPLPPPVISAWRPVAQVKFRSPSLPSLAEGRRGGKRAAGGDSLMKTRAAVAFEARKPLEIVELDLEGPKAGEVLVEIMATGICHTDAYTLDGFDSEGIFPSVLGHEGAGIVREVGAGVTSVKPGDHVIPLYTPECRQCKSCLSGKTNLCTAIRAT